MRCGVLSSAGRLRLVTLAVVALAATGCAAAPEPPPTPQAVVQLSQRYERLTAFMDAATARDLVDRQLPQYAALETLRSLAFLRDVIADATSAQTEDAVQMLEVQGSLQVHAPCPGWRSGAGSGEPRAGFVELVIGVDASRVQRAFTGRAESCRFVARHSGHEENMMANMQLELDLGHSLGLGEPVPALLIRAQHVSTEPSDMFEELELGAPSDVLSVRVVDAGRLEMLIELESLDSDKQGSFLLALREDGRVGVRGRDGEWACGHERSEPCVRAD